MRYAKIAWLLLGLLSTIHLPAQKDLSQLLSQKETYQTIVEKTNAYFSEKHPGTSIDQLAYGLQRDGDYVKFKRWEYFWKHQQLEDGRLGDPTAYFRQPKTTLRQSNPYEIVQWKNIGLHENLGGQIGLGRTTGIDFHPTDPNTFYVSTAFGGIWKTEDKGKNYQNIGEDLPTLAVASVLVDKNDPNTLYAATGDRTWFGYPSVGVYKSEDSGKTWGTTALSWQFSNGIKVYALVANPDNTKEMYLASDAGLFRTKDGFKTVNRINGFRATDVKFKPENPSIVYFTSGGQFWRSTDGGETFSATQAISDPDIMRITVSAANPNLVYVANGNQLYLSDNSGASFQETKDISILGNNGLGYVYLSPTKTNVLYGGFVSSWKSVDNGASWQQITCFSGGAEVHVDNHFAANNPLDPGAIYFCNDGGLYRFEENQCQNCEDCFPAYEDLSTGLFISQYYDISVSQQNNSLISGGTQDNGSFFRSANNRWQFYAPTGDGMIGAIDPKDDNYQYWTYQNGIINRTEFGQSTCISCNIPNDESGNGEWVTPFELDPSTPSTIFAGYKRIYRSFDRGDTWKAISLPLSNGLFDEIAISPSDGRYVYAIEGNRLFRTRNAGSAGFSQWTERKLPSGTISSLEVHPTERETLFITISGYRNGEKVYKSTDAGNNWINISGSLPNVPAMVIKAIRDSNYDEALFVGTGTGVFYREKGMDDWQEYGQLPHTLVMDIEFQYLNQSIRVGTYGRAIFEAALPLSPCFNGNGADADQDGVCDAFDICPNGNDLLDLDNDRAPDACETYCLAAGAAGTGDDYITAVRLNTINQQSEKSSYSDFRSVATELTVGNSYELSIQLNYAFPLDAAYAWIDFNQNREFESWEAIEMSSFNESHISTGVVTLPLDASPGKATLRVRNIYLENQIASPCDKFFGEVEDYTVNINALATNIASISNKTQLFKVFPNPGLNELNIFFEQANFQGPIYLAIVDFSGRTLIGRRYTADQIKTSIAIPTKDLASGIYIIKVQDQRQQSIQKWVRQ